MRSPRCIRQAVLTPLAFALILGPALARAQPPSDKLLAEALFAEGRRLMEDGSFPEACPKLAESHRLDPAGGTVLNLARCRKGEGKTASAWVAAKEALSFARRDNRPDRAEEALKLVDELEPALVHLTVIVPDSARVSGLAITVDGTVLASAAFGVAFPIDPGSHTLEATAPGRPPWSSKVVVSDKPVTITIPAASAQPAPSLAPTASIAPTAPTSDIPVAPSSPSSPLGPQRIAGLAIAVVGAFGIAAAVGTGVQALSLVQESNALCDTDVCHGESGARAVALMNDARANAIASDALFIAGGVLIAGGTITALLAKSPPAPPPRVTAAPWGDGRAAGLLVIGRF